jgi:hypothetical protein
MNLLDAPIVHEGFFAIHFFTPSGQDKSKDFYVEFLAGRRSSQANPCQTARFPTSQRSFLRHRRI